MPSSLPSPDSDYAAPHDMRLNKAAWDAALVSVGLRLRALEAVRASFEALIDLGTGQALQVIQANVAPELQAMRTALAALQTAMAEAEDQVHAIITGSIPASAIVAPTLPPGTADGQLATTAHVAQTVAAFTGAGNRLPNAAGAAGMMGVSVAGPSSMLSGAAGAAGQHTVWLPAGVQGWFLIQQDETDAYSWFDFHDGSGNAFPVQGGEAYQFSVHTGNHRARVVYGELLWFDAAGTLLGTSNCLGGTSVADAPVLAFSGSNGGTSPEAISGPRFSDARRLWLIARAPAAAVRAMPRLVKGPTKAGGGTSALFAYRPYFGEAASGQLLPSAWSYGPATTEIRAAVEALASTASVSAAIRAAVDGLVDAAPGALDTLKELSAALGNDPNFSASVSAALGARLRIDAAQGLTDAAKSIGRDNLGAQAALGYVPANKAGDTFSGNIAVGPAIHQTDGNIYMPWAGGRWLHEMVPYFVETWMSDSQGALRAIYSPGSATILRGAGGADRPALSVQRGGDGAALFQVEGNGDLYAGFYGATLSAVFNRAKNIRLASVRWWDIRVNAGHTEHVASAGEVMVGLTSYYGPDANGRTIAGFFYASLQQQDAYGNWYAVSTV